MKSFAPLLLLFTQWLLTHNASGQALVATNGEIQRSSAAIFPTSGAFFPHTLNNVAATLQSNQFSVSLRTQFALPEPTLNFSGTEWYRYQLRLLDEENTALTLTSGRTTITTSDFLITSDQYREALGQFPSKTQNFSVAPRTPLPISAAATTISIALQRKTTDISTGILTTVWVDEGDAVTLDLEQEITDPPQLRVHSVSSTEIRLAYDYSTTYGEEVFGRWKLYASTTLAANSFAELTGVTPVALSTGVYQYILPITPATEPKKFFRHAN